MQTKKQLLLSDLIYIAKYFEIDGAPMLSLQIGFSPTLISQEYLRIKRSGELEKYRKMEYPKMMADWQ